MVPVQPCGVVHHLGEQQPVPLRVERERERHEERSVAVAREFGQRRQQPSERVALLSKMRHQNSKRVAASSAP